MKAKFIFNLDNQDDQEEFLRHVKAKDLAILLFNIEQVFYKDYESVDEIKSYIREEIEASGINISEILS